MEYLAAFFGWLQKLFASSALNFVIILLLSVLFAFITDEWLYEQYTNFDEIRSSVGITEPEYWLFLILIYGAFFTAIKIVESLIATVLLTNTKEE